MVKRNQSLQPTHEVLQQGPRVRVVSVNQYTISGVQCATCRVVFVGRAVELIFPYHDCTEST